MMREVSRRSSSALWPRLVVVLAVALSSRATAQSMVQSSGFVPGSRQIYALDLTADPVGEFPRSLKLLRGTMDIVVKNGVRMLRASSESIFLLQLPEALPQDFTIEFDLIPKTCCNPNDLAFEGTPTQQRSRVSAMVELNTETFKVVGGGDYYQAPVPAALAAVMPAQLAHVNVTLQGDEMKMYLNGTRLFTLTDRKFVRGTVLRIALGGQDDDKYAVYLARLRVATNAPATTANLPAGPGVSSGPPPTATPQTPGQVAATSAPPAPSSPSNPLPAVPPSNTTTNTSASTSGTITGFTVTPNGAWGAYLKWDVTPNVPWFRVDRSENGQPFAPLLGADPASASSAGLLEWWDFQIKPGAHYDYRVNAMDQSAPGGAYDIVSFSSPTRWFDAQQTFPPPITNLVASVGPLEIVSIARPGMRAAPRPAHKVSWTWNAIPHYQPYWATFDRLFVDPVTGMQTRNREPANPIVFNPPGTALPVEAGQTIRFCVSMATDPNIPSPGDLSQPVCLDTPTPPAPNDATPPNVQVTPVPAGLRVTYSAPGDTIYAVCRESPPGTGCVDLGTVGTRSAQSFSFLDPQTPGSSHAYRVRAIRDDGHYGESAPVSGTAGDIPPPFKPSIVLNNFASGYIDVTWSAGQILDFTTGQNKAVVNHQVLGTGLGSGMLAGNSPAKVPFTPGLTHWEWNVCSMVPDGAGSWWFSRDAAKIEYNGPLGSGQLNVSTIPCTAMPLPNATGTILTPNRPTGATPLNDATPPSLVNLNPIPAGVKVIYTSVSGAVRYEVCRESPPGGTCKLVSFPNVEVAGNTLAHYDVGLMPSTQHAYRVRAFRSDGHFGETVPITASAGIIPPPQNLRAVKFDWPASRMELAWDPVAVYDATGALKPMPQYQIVQSAGGSTVLNSTTPQITLSLSGGAVPYQWKVTALYPDGAGGQWSSPQSTFDYSSNHYRIQALGLWAKTTTNDNPSNADGIGDEVYLAAVVSATNRTLTSKAAVGSFRMMTYGSRDVARFEAGTASATGGIRSGDLVTTELSNWINTGGMSVPTTSPPEPGGIGFPIRLWEGTLDDTSMVVILPSLWEDDGLSWQNRDWMNKRTLWASQNFSSTFHPRIIAQLRDSDFIGPGKGSYSDVRCLRAISLTYKDPLCTDFHDRPLGLEWAGSSMPGPEFNVFEDRILVLTRSAIEKALAAAGPARNQPGTIIVDFTDRTTPAEASYQLYLRVQRLPCVASQLQC